MTSNWAGNVHIGARREVRASRATAATPKELARRMGEVENAVRRAVAEGRRIRPLGSAWSFSPLLQAEDDVVSVTSFDQILGTSATPLLANALHPTVTAPVGYVEAGVELHTLFAALRSEGLAVVTAGSSSGQTIAGVMSTSTHGADFDRPPLPDYVRALALVSPAGERLWLEPKARPLTRDDTAAATLLPGARVVRDDRLFDAARVGVGVMGIVCALVLEVRPMPLMSEQSTKLSWAVVRNWLKDGGTAFGPTPPGAAHSHTSPGAKYTFMEVLLNPFRDAAGKRTAQVVTRLEAPGTAPQWTRTRGNILDALRILLVTATGDVSAYRAQIDDLLADGRQDSQGFHPAPDVFDYGNARRERVWSYEAVLSTAGNAHLSFLDALLARWDGLAAQGKRVAGFLSVRFTRGTSASLGMQRGPTGASGRYCHVEFSPLQHPIDLGGWDPKRVAAEGADYVSAFLAEVSARRSGGVAALHWGQQAAHPSQMRPSPKRYDLSAWQASWSTLSGDSPWTSSNAWTVQTGLTPLVSPWKQVGSPLPTDRSSAPLGASGIAASAPVLLEGRLYAGDANGYVSSLPVDGTSASARWKIARDGQERVQQDEAIRGAIAVARNADGRHEIFGRGTDGRIYHRWQRGAGWRGWTPLTGGPTFASDPSATRIGDRLVVAAVDARGKVQTRRQSNLGWHGWVEHTALPGALRAVGRPALLRRADGVVVMFVRDQTQKLWGAELDGPWRSLGLESAGHPAAALDFGGGVVVAGPALNGGLRAAHVSAAWAVTPHATMARIAIRPHTTVAIARLDSEHAVAFTDPKGQVIHYRLRAAGFQPSSGPLPALAVSGPCLQPWPGDRLRVFTRITHDLLQARNA
ncbi:MAG: FAD-binding protein [Sandaracinaceae bacterium]